MLCIQARFQSARGMGLFSLHVRDTHLILYDCFGYSVLSYTYCDFCTLQFFTLSGGLSNKQYSEKFLIPGHLL
jgi:hypothetical protein